MASIITTRKVALKIPSLPNFILAESGEKFALYDLDNATIREIADGWREAFLKKAGVTALDMRTKDND